MRTRGTFGTDARLRGGFATLLAIATFLSLAASAEAAIPQPLWQRCDGSAGDLSCNLARGMGVSPVSGHVYIIDNGNNRIIEYTAWGEFVRAWGWGVGTGAAEPQTCTAVAGCLDGINGGGAGQIGGAQGAAVDSAGNVYVAEFANQRVQKFDAEGNFIVMFGGKVNKTKVEESKLPEEQNRCPVDLGDVCQKGTEGNGASEFKFGVVGGFIGTGPSPENLLYVGDKERVQVFNPDGTFKEKFPDPDGIIAKEGTVQSLAPAPGNGLYLIFNGKADVIRLTAAGKKSCTVNEANPSAKLTKPRALAVAASATGVPTGNLYVFDEALFADEVRQFSTANATNCVDREEPFAKGDVAVSTGLAASVACLNTATVNKSGPDVYLSNAFSPSSVRAYGPAPDKTELCPKPLLAPEILAQYATTVGTVEAVLRAEINPRFYADTTFQLRYGTAACLEGGGWEAACVEEKPIPPASLGAEAVDFPATSPSVAISGLIPATVYRYRFVAQSLGGGPVEGPEQSFTTFSLPMPPLVCPNDAFRIGAAASLPDCRAYELVSPVDKEGGQILALDESLGRTTALDRSSTSGEKLTYSSYTPFAGAASAPYTSQYVASRDEEEGWSSEAISPPRGVNFVEAGSGEVFAATKGEFEAFSADLCEGWLLRDNTTAPPLAAGATPYNRNYYRRENCGAGAGGYEALGKASSSTPARLQGVAADGETAIFRTDVHLSQEAATAVGTKLNCTSPTPVTASFQWLREGAPIGAATTSTYTAKAEDAGKTIQCRMRASNAVGGSVQDANPVWVIAPYPASAPPEAPAGIPPPSTSGPLAVGGASGQTLSCDPDAAPWGGSPAFAYRWYLNGTEIAGAESAEYTVQAADLASPAYFQCEAIAENAGGKVAAASEVLPTSPAPGAPVARPNMATNQAVLYEALGEGEVRAVCVLPGSGTESSGCTAGTANLLGGVNSATVERALSADGSRVLWTNASGGEGEIFLRLEGETTVPVSEAATGGVARFWTAAADGSRAIISGAGKLYEVDLADPEAPAATLIAEGFAGMVGASEDATLLYFASTKALTGAEENSEGAVAQAGQPNLYLRRVQGGGEALSFVARLAGVDIPSANGGSTGASPVAVEPYEHAARTSADGESLAFMSRGSLTGYDNADSASGEADAEVFRYDAAAGELSCASCNPSGTRPAGRVVVSGITGNLRVPTAAQLPPIESQLYASRVLSEDGKRLFFESFDPLILSDTNGKADVYEWEAAGTGNCVQGGAGFSALNEGCVSLISSGKDPADSRILDASPDGRDVFFATGESLLPFDPGAIDVYDARVEGGFPLPPAPQPPCEGEACQSPPPPPAEVTPASESFRGEANPKPSKGRCGKGKRRVVRKGKARCVKRKGARKRAAHQSGRTVR